MGLRDWLWTAERISPPAVPETTDDVLEKLNLNLKIKRKRGEEVSVKISLAELFCKI